MKKTALLIIAVVGVGSFIVPGGAGAAESLVNTNIVGAANETKNPAWVIDDATATDYFIQGSTITAEPGIDVEYTAVPNAASSLGNGGLKSSAATAHNVTVIDSTITASDGGNMVLDPNFSAGGKEFHADGGNGMLLKNVTGVFDNATVTGGNGGKVLIKLAGPASSVNGGYGMELQGNSTLHATNSIIKGGNGGELDADTYTGTAGSGDGIVVNASGSVVVLDLSNTVVSGGDGGSVALNWANKADVDGGNALTVGGGATLTVKGGTFVGGKAGTIGGGGGDVPEDGKSIDVTGANLILAGGSFAGGILFSAGNSTLALESTFQDAPINFSGTTLKVTKWSDGQLSDVMVNSGTVTLDGSSAYNLGGDFMLGGTFTKPAVAKFDSGLVVDSTGTLGLGYGESTADGIHTKAGSTIVAMRSATKMGTLKSLDSMTLDAGTTWIIVEDGNTALNIGDKLTLASITSGLITNNLQLADVSYVGKNGTAGWLGKIVSLNTTPVKVEAEYGQGDIDEMLGVKGNVSSIFGKASADLTSLVAASSSSSNILVSLANLTQDRSVAYGLATNGLIRTAQSAKSAVVNQQLYVGIINRRTHSYLNHEGVGYPVEGPGGSAGWDLLRSFSDRVESNVGTDGLRSFSDRVEGRYGYDDVASTMRNAEEGTSLSGLRLPESWQIWGEGFGSSAQQDTINGVAGYEAGTGGAMLGVDKRFNNLMLGVAGGFSQSSVDGYQENNARIDTLNVIGYLSAYNENAYMDFNVSYAMNNVDTEFKSYGYTGNYDADALSFYLGGGYAIALNDWLMLTPEASFMGTYYSRDGYDETSTLLLPTKQYDSYDQFSPVGTVGATLTMMRKIDLRNYEMLMQPEFRAHLVHDFNADMDPETYGFQGGTYNIETPVITTEDNLFKVGAGIRLSEWNNSSTELNLDVDGLFADGYNAFVISGKIVHRF